MNKLAGLRMLLAEAEEEARRAGMAVAAGIKGAEMRKSRADIEVDRWRRRVLVASESRCTGGHTVDGHAVTCVEAATEAEYCACCRADLARGAK